MSWLRSLAAAGVLVLGASACSGILGLGDFKDAPVDASVGTGGGAGTDGGTSGTSGTGGSAAHDGGNDVVESGPPPPGNCSLRGDAFDIFENPEGGTRGYGSNQLLLVPHARVQPQLIFVVASVGQNIEAQSVIDNTAQSATAIRTGPGMELGAGRVVNGQLEVYGWDQGTLQYVTFPLDSNGLAADASAPTPLSNSPPDCRKTGWGIKSAGMVFDTQGNLHWAVTCGDTNNTVAELFVDTVPTPIASGDGNDPSLQVGGCVYLNGTYVVAVGGSSNFQSQFRIGATSSELAQTYPFQLVAGDAGGRINAALGIWPSGQKVGVLAALSDDPYPNLLPGTVKTGVVTPQDLKSIPATGFQDLLRVTRNNQWAVPTPSRPGVAEDGTIWWGYPALDQSIRLVRLRADGTLGFNVTQIVPPADGGAGVDRAAAQGFGPDGLVVWSNANTEHLSGQIVGCL